MNLINRLFIALTLSLLSFPLLADSEPDGECTGVFCTNADTFSNNIRIRAASIDDSVNERATALTARLFLSMQTNPVNNWNVVLGIEHVNDLGQQRYNDGGTNRQFKYATEVDPQGTELDEAYLQYNTGRLNFKLGRQYLNLGKFPPRYVGHVGWRQNFQTIDSVKLEANLTEKFMLQATVLEKAHRVVGSNHPSRFTREYDLDGFVLRGILNLGEYGELEGYVYHLDFVNHPGFSTQTTGFKYEVTECNPERPFRLKAYCALEFATQSSIGLNPNDEDYWYGYSELSIYLSSFNSNFKTARAGFAVNRLNGDGLHGAFRTPLATLHAYAGWADKFLIQTPATGLIDGQIKVSGELSGWKVNSAYHVFKSNFDFGPGVGELIYGREFDVSASRTFGKYSWLIKLAHYVGDDDVAGSSLGLDSTKFWTSVQFSL